MSPSIADILAESSLVDTPRLPAKPRSLHPLDNLTVDEINATVRIVKSNRPNDHLWIKHCAVREPVSRTWSAYANWRLAPMHRLG
jgi:Cu2+-containing amine oxidase